MGTHGNIWNVYMDRNGTKVELVVIIVMVILIAGV